MAKETLSTARTVLRAPKSSPRTGKCLVSPLTCSNGWAAPPMSSIGFSISTCGLSSLITSVPDVHGAAHAVAKQVETDRDRENHGPRQRGHPRIDIDRGAQRVEHQAPFRLRRLGAEAEKREAGRKDHRDRDQAGGVDKNRPQHIAQHMYAHDRKRAGARCA